MFTKTSSGGIVLWSGSPDSQAAHSQLLTALKTIYSTFLPVDTVLTTRRMGNLGEFIAHAIGSAELASCKVIAANAHNPLADISRADLDLLWIFFGATSDQDFGIIQEVKTTGDPSLGYANSLISDYAKLFETDPACTLQSRFGVAANTLAGMKFPAEICCRTRDLGGISPQTSPQVRLMPTLVHEATGSNPTQKLTAVRSTLVGSGGWPGQAVECWSVGLDDLEKRLARLSWGQ